MLITSKDAHKLAVSAFKAQDLGVDGLRKYTDPNPFKPHVGVPAVIKAFYGRPLSKRERLKFQRFKDSGKEIEENMSSETMRLKVIEVLEDHGIDNYSKFSRGELPNPLKGYIGIKNVLKLVSGGELGKITRRRGLSFFEKKSRGVV